MSINKLQIESKVSNQGESSKGKLSATEFNEVVNCVNDLVDTVNSQAEIIDNFNQTTENIVADKLEAIGIVVFQGFKVDINSFQESEEGVFWVESEKSFMTHDQIMWRDNNGKPLVDLLYRYNNNLYHIEPLSANEFDLHKFVCLSELIQYVQNIQNKIEESVDNSLQTALTALEDKVNSSVGIQPFSGKVETISEVPINGDIYWVNQISKFVSKTPDNENLNENIEYRYTNSIGLFRNDLLYLNQDKLYMIKSGLLTEIVSLDEITAFFNQSLQEYKDEIQGIISSLQETTNQTFDGLVSQITELQNQVDGVIESFNGFGAPTLSNYPANEWITDAERQRHDRDIYTDITPYVDDSTTPTSGQSWKWYYNSTTDYGWTKIADSEAVKALQLAQMSVLDTNVLYKQINSSTDSPDIPAVNTTGAISDLKGWSNTAPTWQDGMYIWQTTYVKKGDGSATFSTPICISGRNGTSVTISSQSVKYSTNHGATQPADSTFTLTAVPTLSAGQYLWGMTTVTYSNGQSTKSYAVSRIGTNGQNGTDGNSYTPNLVLGTADNIISQTKVFDLDCDIKDMEGETITISFDYEYKNVTTGNSFNQARFGFEIPVPIPNNDTWWMGRFVDLPQNSTGLNGKGKLVKTREVPTEVAASLTYGNFFVQVQSGEVKVWNLKVERGNNPNPQWTPAASEMVAPTIVGSSVTYAKTTNNIQPTDSAFAFTSIASVGLTLGEYLWSKTEVIYSDGTTTKSYTVSRIGSDGADGLPGVAGADGNTPYVHFAYASGITGNLPHPTAITGFSTTSFAGAKYIGVCTDYNQADPTTNVANVYEWSEYKGEDGVGIDHIEEEYCLSTSSSSPTPNVWYDEEHKPTWVAGKYMWTRSHVYYTDGTDETFGEVCVTGATGTSVLAQYSATGGSNASEWHPTFVSGDKWMRTSSDGGQNWNPAIRIVGQNGANYTPNLAMKTSEAWIAPESVFGNAVNLTSFMYNVYGLKTGDTFTVSFDYEATGLVFNGSSAWVSFQFGPDYKWQGFNFFIKQNGRGRFVRTAVLTGEGIDENVNGRPICRFDYMSKNSGGSFRIWNFKVEKGANENPEWTPAASEMVGKDGKWRKYQWGVTTSSTTANGITYWQDTPMTAPAGQYVWMRSGIVTPPATEPTSYDPATRLTGDKGADGQSVYMLDLSNEVMGILCDSSGAVTGQYSTSQACVWKGSEKLTSGITYSIAQTGGVSATVTPAGLVTPSALTKDNATIVVQAVVGSVTLQSTITLYKVKAGANGANGTNGANYSPNLMLNTDFSKGTKYWNMGTGGGFSNPQNTCTIDTAIKHEGRDSVKIVAAGNETAVWWGLGVKRENVPTLQIKGGQTITLSFWICTDNLASIDDKAACEIACYNASGSKVNGGYTPITPTKNAVWEKRVLTFTTGSDVVSIAPWIYVGKNGRIWVSSIKVEIGNNPNPQWTPASSEMVGVNGADAVVYSLEPSVDNITKSMTGELSATSVTCTVYKTTGNSQRVRTSEKQVSYQVIKSDGTTLTGTKTPTDGVTSEVTVTPDTEAIIWELKGDNNVLLDRERVPVLADASDLEVGGTNLARGTSEAWFAPDIAFSNQQNRTVNAYDVYGLKTGDTFTVSFDYEVVGVSFGSNSAFNLQFNGWGWIGRGKIITVNSKGHYTLTRELTTADITEETNGLFGFRFDYLSRSSGGYIKIWNVKVEKGNVETAWAPAPQDTAGKIEAITTEITNINNQIDLAVKKNDLTVAGINLSTDGVTITGNKTTIKGNDGKTYAMFSEIDGVPVLDANLINARTFVARDADGNPLTSFNLEGDGIIRHYYPGTSQRQYESGVVTITVVDENNKITPITTVGRYYAEDDSLLWWLSPEGLDKPQLPYYFETLMLTQNGLINTDTDLSAYATPYQVLRSTSEATCAVHGLHSYRTHDGETFKNAQSIESTNLIPNGTYYSPTLVKAINPPTTLGLGTGVINPEQQIIGYRYRYDFHNGRCAAPMLYVIYKDNTAVEVL